MSTRSLEAASTSYVGCTSVRRPLAFDGLRSLVNVFFISRVDYCNALLYGVAAYVIRHLRSVLHATERLISSVQLYQHITPTLHDTLHWLPVPAVQRIHYEIAMMTFKCARSTCPALCRPVHLLVHVLCGVYGVLVEHKTNTKQYNPRSFRISAPAV